MVLGTLTIHKFACQQHVPKKHAHSVCIRLNTADLRGSASCIAASESDVRARRETHLNHAMKDSSQFMVIVFVGI